MKRLKSWVSQMASHLLIERKEGLEQPLRILLIAAWFSVVAGLVEGLLQGLAELQTSSPMTYIWLRIIWVAPLITLILFGAGGLVLASVSRLFPRLVMVPFAVLIFAFLAFSGWLPLALPWQIHRYAIYLLALGLAVVFTRWFQKHQVATLKFWRRSLPLALAVALLAFGGVQGGFWLQERAAIANLPPALPGTPNILVLVIDTLRADHLSSYGYHRLTSPNLDRFAAEGVLFEAAFSTAPYTAPSHASLLTGRYPHEHGVQWIDEQPKLDERYPTLSEALRDRGYRTAAFSANVFWFTREKGFGRGFTRFEDYFRSSGDTFMRAHHGIKFMDIVLRRLGFEDIPGRRNAEDINRSVLRWIEGNTDKPFFAFVNYIDTHDPYFPPQPYRSQFSTVENPGGLINHAFSDSTPQLTPSQIQSEIDAYDGSISYADARIAQLMADIRDRGLEDNLMVIVTSDHGEAFGEHGAFIHANSVYREEIHVPLIFWMPGQIPTGVRVAQPVTNASFRPPSWVSLARPIRIYSRLRPSSLFGKPRERILTGRSLWPKWNTGLICQRSLHPVKAQWSHW